MSAPEFVLLSRPGCHLCEEFAAQFAAQAAGQLALRIVDIDQHPGWQQQYGLRIPVLLDPDGAFCCELRLDQQRLQAWLLPSNAADG